MIFSLLHFPYYIWNQNIIFPCLSFILCEHVWMSLTYWLKLWIISKSGSDHQSRLNSYIGFICIYFAKRHHSMILKTFWSGKIYGGYLTLGCSTSSSSRHLTNASILWSLFCDLYFVVNCCWNRWLMWLCKDLWFSSGLCSHTPYNIRAK